MILPVLVGSDIQFMKNVFQAPYSSSGRASDCNGYVIHLKVPSSILGEGIFLVLFLPLLTCLYLRSFTIAHVRKRRRFRERTSDMTTTDGHCVRFRNTYSGLPDPVTYAKVVTQTSSMIFVTCYHVPAGPKRTSIHLRRSKSKRDLSNSRNNPGRGPPCSNHWLCMELLFWRRQLAEMSRLYLVRSLTF